MKLIESRDEARLEHVIKPTPTDLLHLTLMGKVNVRQNRQDRLHGGLKLVWHDGWLIVFGRVMAQLFVGHGSSHEQSQRCGAQNVLTGVNGCRLGPPAHDSMQFTLPGANGSRALPFPLCRND
jgi:hypothetical protein